MSNCGIWIGDWACRDGGYLYDAGSGEGWDPEDGTHICPNCRTKDYLLAAKEEAEGVSYWSNNGSAGDGLDIWVAAERRALEINREAAEKALAEIGVVEALERDDSEQGYRVTLCNTGAAVESKGAQA